jgi:DNA replication factor GINS
LSVEHQAIEVLKQLLDAEEQSADLTKLPPDTYTSVAAYVQKLRRSSEIGAEDPLSRLTRKQLALLEGMGRQLLNKRIAKAAGKHDMRDLLPEEKFVCESLMEFERMKGNFVKALVNGQQSVFTALQKNQMQKKVIVCFQKPLGEVIGFDLNRYGPFRVHDVAEIPAANAEVLVSNGDATIVYAKDSF